MAPQTFEIEQPDGPATLEWLRPLPGRPPANIPGLELAMGQGMWDEGAASQPGEIWQFDNRSSRSRDPDDGRLMVPLPAHVIETPARAPLELKVLDAEEDHGSGFSITFDDEQELSLVSDLAYLKLRTSHAFCIRCKDLLDHWCKGQTVPNQNCVVHHHNLVSLVLGEFLECHLCSLIFRRLDHMDPGALRPAENMQKFRIEACWTNGTDELGEREANRIFFAMVDPSQPKHKWNWSEVYRLQLWPFTEFEKCFLAGTETWQRGLEWAHDLLEELRTSDRQEMTTSHPSTTLKIPSASDMEDRGDSTNSWNTITLARTWLQQCLSNSADAHTECNHTSTPQRLPRRILDVRTVLSTSSVKLVCPYDSFDQPLLEYSEHIGDPYITLSHKWGSLRLPVLLTENLQERQDIGLPYDTLPETFKQAIAICNWFNVRWIYIDCLCIIQNSQEDWAIEAASMGRYYSSALLCISASAAENAKDGCWARRDPSSLTAPVLSVQKRDDMAWFLTKDHHWQFKWMATMPLFRRAWCHRERQLSKRVLHFTHQEVVWECCGQDGANFRSESLPGGAPFSRLFEADERKFQSASLTGQSRKEILAVWNDLCEGFSQKSLTKGTDMPVILSSLAEEFHALLTTDNNKAEQYISGLWQSTLPQSLLWFATDTKNDPVPLDSYVAPSWSWLSQRSPVQLYGNRESSSIKSQLAIVDDLTLDPQYPDQPFGALTWSTLEMTCIVRKAQFSGGVDGYSLLAVLDDDDKWREVGISFDSNFGNWFELSLDRHWNAEADFVECHLLFIELDPGKAGRNGNERMLKCLVVKEVEHQISGYGKMFRRIGTLKLHDLYALKMRYHVVHAQEDVDFEKWAAMIRDDVDQVSEANGKDWEEEVREPDPMLLYRCDRAIAALVDGTGPVLRRLEAESIVLV